MATTKITELPSLTTPDANTSNTVFVVVDKSSGTPTTKQVTLGVLDTAIDDVAAGAYNQANAAYDAANTSQTHAEAAFTQANTNTTSIGNVYTHANGAFDAANSASTLAQDAYDYANTIVSDTQVDPYARAHANGAFDQANTDVTTVSISAGDYGSEVIIPVVHLEANGRVSSVTNTNIRSASTTETGVILIEDSVTSTSTSNAASPNSVKTAYDYAQAAFDAANVANTDMVQAAYDHANGAFEQANTTQSTTQLLVNETLQVVANVPLSPIGADGDSANEVALANDYIYIAIADYDGSTNIWVRFAVTDSW